MEYKYIEIDFMKRTKKLINDYKGEHRVTLLINCCLGLLVLPKEKHFNVKTLPDGTGKIRQYPGTTQFDFTLLMSR